MKIKFKPLVGHENDLMSGTTVFKKQNIKIQTRIGKTPYRIK